MLPPFMIPENFDIATGHISGEFTSLLDCHYQLLPEEVFAWSAFLTKWSVKVELESMTWASKILDKSMTPDLKLLVHENLDHLPPEERGGVSKFKIAIDLVIHSSQEGHDALRTWLNTFSILAYDGENVAVAGRECRAVIRALGDNLPTNLMQLLLDGFARATSTDFSGHCQMLVTILRSNMLSTTFLGSRSVNFSLSDAEKAAKLKSETFDMLKDLEGTFARLNALTKWDGVGHDGK
jgi:hypothetical protein